MLHMEHLTKDYGNGQGVFDICLDCEKGQIIGLVGSNGSGKTTLIKTILQLLPYQEGTIQWKEQAIKDIFEDIAYITDTLSFLPVIISCLSTNNFPNKIPAFPALSVISKSFNSTVSVLTPVVCFIVLIIHDPFSKLSI